MDADKKLKQTQGHDKMLLYLEELVRNKHFRMLGKRLRRLSRHKNLPEGKYDEWTNEEKKEHDYINNEIGSLIDEYERLRKRCKKLFRDRGFGIREKIASYYGLDNNLMNLALAMIEKDEQAIYFAKMHAEPDMCQLIDLNEEVSPYNKCEEIIWMRPVKQIFCAAYPVAMAIHPRASKRDVLLRTYMTRNIRKYMIGYSF